ncbi:hypothetical protein [Synechococcus sp. MEDNS5]|uniref:hypothetical protein n=1 Tax=Synechococcus sp. MEDNS5 TaxID=1442554 RepID=UPI0016482F74|nr:hypothetical protein [Synechococcus sp. MEDNS5]
MAFQIKNKDFTPWLHFIPSRKAYDQGCLLYLVEADPLGTGDTLLKVGLTLESDPMRRDPKAFKRVLSQFQVPAGINPMLVEKLTRLCCSRVGVSAEHANSLIEGIVNQEKRWGGWTELVHSKDPVVATTFDSIAPRICDYLQEHPETAALQEWNLLVHLWKAKYKNFRNKVPYSCGNDPYFDFAIEAKGPARTAIGRRITKQLQPITDQFPTKERKSYRQMALERIKENFEGRKAVGLYEQGYYYRETGINLSGRPKGVHPNFPALEPMDKSTIKWVLQQLDDDPDALRIAMYGVPGTSGSVPCQFLDGQATEACVTSVYTDPPATRFNQGLQHQTGHQPTDDHEPALPKVCSQLIFQYVGAIGTYSVKPTLGRDLLDNAGFCFGTSLLRMISVE